MEHVKRDIQTKYPSELKAVSSLAPCASSAFVIPIQALTSDSCLTSRTDLASCACGPESTAAVAGITSRISQLCGPTATEDVTSVLTLFSAYCAGATDVSFVGLPVSSSTEYIENMSPISRVSQCASSGIVSVIQHLTISLCPAPPAALASCACLKNDNSAAVSSSIRSAVSSMCGHTASAQIQGAVAVFFSYCETYVITTGVAHASASATADASVTTDSGDAGPTMTGGNAAQNSSAVEGGGGSSARTGAIAGAGAGVTIIVASVFLFCCFRRGKDGSSSWFERHREKGIFRPFARGTPVRIEDGTPVTQI